MSETSVKPKVLRYPEAAAYLGISHGRLRNLVSWGMGPDSVTYGKRDRRFPIAALDAFIAARPVKAQPEAVDATPIKRRPGRPRKTDAVTRKQMVHWIAVLIALLIGYLFWSLGLLSHPIGPTALM